jgi:pyridoxamine 5'-phosphate oxidase
MDIEHLRKEYSLKELSENTILPNPFEQFDKWFQEACSSKILEPNAMLIATATLTGAPSCRTVLLKKYDAEGYTFFTNYGSRKARELDQNPRICATFLWKELERQIHIEGTVQKTTEKESAKYFAKRPRKSQLAAWASQQSFLLPSREALEEAYKKMELKFLDQDIPVPTFWGGYRIIPSLFEFWQGRENRLHDRICYSLENDQWNIFRLFS